MVLEALSGTLSAREGLFLRGCCGNSLSQNLSVLPAPSGREPLARPQALRFSRKLFRTAKGPIPEGAVERSETGGVCSRRAREQQLFPVWKTAIFPAFSTQKNGSGPVLKTWGQPFQIGEK